MKHLPLFEIGRYFHEDTIKHIIQKLEQEFKFELPVSTRDFVDRAYISFINPHHTASIYQTKNGSLTLEFNYVNVDGTICLRVSVDLKTAKL